MPNFVFKLTDSISKISLPYEVSAKKVKIVSLRYITALANLEFMLINLKNFNHDNTYISSTQTLPYTKFIALSNTINANHYYENLDEASYDYVSRVDNNRIKNLDIEIMVDGSYATSSHVSSSYPVYVEFKFSD